MKGNRNLLLPVILVAAIAGTACGFAAGANAEGSAVKANAAEDNAKTQPINARLLSSIEISIASLSKKPIIEIKIDDSGRAVQYRGVALRTLLSELIPEITNMAEWKTLAKRKIIVEVGATDDFSAFIAATEIAINPAGDRFLLATEMNGKPLESVRLVCPMDQHRVRWVRDVNLVKFIQVDHAAQ